MPDANNHAVEPEVIPFDNNSGMGTVDIDSLEDIDISMSGSSVAVKTKVQQMPPQYTAA